MTFEQQFAAHRKACVQRHHNAECDGLEQVALALAKGDTHPMLRDAAEKHLSDCSLCRQAMLMLAAEPSAPVAKTASAWHHWFWIATSVAAMCLLVLALPQDTPLQIKGSKDRFEVMLSRDGAVLHVTPQTQLRTGDRLTFFYSTKRPGYLNLLAVDAAGKSNVLFSGEIASGLNTPLSNGGIASPGIGCEWFVAVFSDSPLTIQTQTLSELATLAQRTDKACNFKPFIVGARNVSVLPVRR
jgi:hypothetical protein